MAISQDLGEEMFITQKTKSESNSFNNIDQKGE